MFVLRERCLSFIWERESRKLVLFAGLWKLGVEAVTMATEIDKRVWVDVVVQVRCAVHSPVILHCGFWWWVEERRIKSHQ